ncbi:MAG: GntR family transcriptional regulator [Brevundimonas sp.]|jgi:DNA-binding transcriptional regulator YhcF (GntR family)|uniref:GntR family transcriptional regulator n=1 Tax=Brevundimonas sp. TaxID=1871086 RepID=UPI00391ACCFA
MRTRDPFGQALAALRLALGEGLAPGHHLSIADIAQDLRLSTSPIREALSRLCGEGLIEDRRGQGYFVRSTPTEDIVGLLQLEQAHVELAMRLEGVSEPSVSTDAEVAAWIAALMDRCVSEPLAESYGRIAGRLAPIRRLGAPTSDDSAGGLGAYYARWTAAAPSLAVRLRRFGQAPAEYTDNTV